MTEGKRPHSAELSDEQVRRQGRLRYDKIPIALSKARAARLLIELAPSTDYVDLPRVPGIRGRRGEAEAREWIEAFGFTALDSALQDIERAYRDIVDQPPPRGPHGDENGSRKLLVVPDSGKAGA